MDAAEEPCPAAFGGPFRGISRTAVVILGVALAATFTGTVGLFSVSAQVIAPSAGSTSSSSALPVCPPGQEAKTVAGSGTPAPLGNLENVLAGIAGGGTFAGVALDAEQVKMAATVAAVGKQMGITRRGIEIGIAVATEQSSLRPDAVNDKWLVKIFDGTPRDCPFEKFANRSIISLIVMPSTSLGSIAITNREMSLASDRLATIPPRIGQPTTASKCLLFSREISRHPIGTPN